MKHLALTIGFAAMAFGPAQAQDVAAGEKIFKRCMACHQVGEGAKNRNGPVLNGVVGRQAGSFEGFKYGKSMVAAGEGGLVWDDETLFGYLADPTKYLREVLDDDKAKARMSFKLKKEDDRKNVIAYLASFSDAAAAGGDDEAAVSEVCIQNDRDEDVDIAVPIEGGDTEDETIEAGEEYCIEVTLDEPSETTITLN